MWFRRYPRGQTDTQTDILITILRIVTSGQGNLTKGRIAAAHGWFNVIGQMAPV